MQTTIFEKLIFVIWILLVIFSSEKSESAELKSVCEQGSIKKISDIDACPALCYQFPSIGNKIKFLASYGDDPSSTLNELSGGIVVGKNTIRLSSIHVWDESEGCFCFIWCFKCNGPEGNWWVSVIPYLESHGVPTISTGCAGQTGKGGSWYIYTLHVTGPISAGCEFHEPSIGTQYLSFIDFILWDWDIPWQPEWSPDIFDECNPQPDPQNPQNPLKPKPAWCDELKACEENPQNCNYKIALRFYESDEECTWKGEWGSLIGLGNDPEGSMEISKNSPAITEFEADNSVHYRIINIAPNSPSGESLQKDWDLDGILNEDELFIAFDPNSNDTDEDGIADYDEIKFLWDKDGDHILSFHDNCAEIYNPTQLDNDNDVKGDECDLDDDNDGIADEVEISLGLDPWVSNDNVDSDGDGLLDFDEVMKYKTDPKNSDTDGDGIDDGNEIIYLLNPLDSSDGKQDTDNDGLSNALEFQLGTHYKKGDTDDDGMPDGWEYKFGLKLTQKDGEDDIDNDGLTNLEEYQMGLDPTNPDTDDDGVIDGQDNCPQNPNPDQSDVNENGFGDACDMDADSDGFIKGADCNDLDPKINQNQKEIPYDGLDNDCLPQTPDDDIDGDGYKLIDDCDDNDATINSGKKEILFNGKDDDCNPETSDCDYDNDGFDDCFHLEQCANTTATEDFCDCDDNDSSINPKMKEVEYNGKDDDCSPDTRDDDLDFDSWPTPADCNDSAYAVNPMMYEVCNNGIDDNCNGQIDENCEKDDLIEENPAEKLAENAIVEDYEIVETPSEEISTIWVEPATSGNASGGCGLGLAGNTENIYLFVFGLSLLAIFRRKKLLF